MQILVFGLFAVLCIGAVVRPLWALVLVLLMYPMEQSLQGAVPAFRDYPPLANISVALVVGTSAVLAALRQASPFLGYFSSTWWMIMVLYAWMGVSLLWTPANPVATEITVDGIPYFVLFVLAAPILIDELADVQKFVKLLLIFGTLTAITIIVNPEFNFQYGRLGLAIVGKVRTSPLAMGELGGTLVILAILYRGARGQHMLTLVRVAAITIGATLALYSGSRGQFLFAIFVTVLCYPMCRKQKNVMSYFGTLVGVLFFLAAMAVVASFVLDDEMVQRWTGAQLGRGATARELNFVELFSAFFNNPGAWLFGLGFNAFTAVTTANNEPYSHSILLDALCELGVPAFALYCVIMWFTFKAGSRLFKAVKEWPEERAAITILLAFAIYQFMLSNKQGMFWTAGPLFLHYLLIVRLDARMKLELVEPVAFSDGDADLGVLPQGAP
jgi:hypothetical protein